MKYLVIADTYQYGYGCEYSLFGIFDTRDEAIKWIIDNPVIVVDEPDLENGYDGEKFFFFHNYEEGKGYFHLGRNGERIYKEMSKEEYVQRMRFIHEFNGEPMYIGGYQE